MDGSDRDRGTWPRRWLAVLARSGAGLALALAVVRELLRTSDDDDHGMVVESDGDDAWAG